MDVDILSLFPEYFESPLNVSILKRARDRGLLNVNAVNIRDFAEGKYLQVDDRPYGGGPGMVLMPQPVVSAIRSVKRDESYVVYLSPQGSPLNAEKAQELAKRPHLILLCGHYEGVDERVIDLCVDEEVSLGDFVLTSGAPAALALIDATARFIPGVVGQEDSVRHDSYEDGLFDTPHYTRPPSFEGLDVPEVLLSGHHREIEKWRDRVRREKTERIRPDLYAMHSTSRKGEE